MTHKRAKRAPPPKEISKEAEKGNEDLSYDEKLALVQKKKIICEYEFQKWKSYPRFEVDLKKVGLLELSTQRSPGNTEFVYNFYATRWDKNDESKLHFRGTTFISPLKLLE